MNYFDEEFTYHGMRFIQYHHYFDENDLIEKNIGYIGQYIPNVDYNTIVAEWGKEWTLEIKNLAMLDDTLYGPYNKETECVICYENIYNTPNSVHSCTDLYRYFSQCNHIFHLDCIYRWIDNAEDKNASCPMCRGIITFEIKWITLERYYSSKEQSELDLYTFNTGETFSKTFTI